MPVIETPEVTPERARYYDKIREQGLSPLWMVFNRLITRTPESDCRPYLWRYADLKPLLLEAGGLISAAEAERRVLILENPGMPDSGRITTSLYAGLQLVLPGEVAPAHRHSQSALRFVVDGDGAYTAVDGERTVMRPGDFVITPPWAWHDHGNESGEPMIWMDGLDIPVLQFFDASFAEPYSGDLQPVTRQTGDSLARFGANMLPVDHARGGSVSPIFNYPYARSREALEQLKRQEEWDPCHGLKLCYVNPLNGDAAMPTISAFIQLLPAGFETAPYRSTDATVFTPVEGRGFSTIAGQRFDWADKDVFVAPSWATVVHHPEMESVLFSFSDRTCQEKLGIFREQRNPDDG